MKRLKIIYIQETDWLEKGPQQQHHLFERLSNQGHSVIVIDYNILWRKKLSKGFISKRIMKKSPSKACEKCDITLIRPTSLRLPIFNYLSIMVTYGKEIMNLIKNYEPDIIVGAGILTISLVQSLAHFYEIPYIQLTVDKLHSIIPSSIFRPLGLALESRIAKKADYTVVINEQLKDYEIRLGSDPNLVSVIRAGVELELFQSNSDIRKKMRRKYGFNANDRVLFFMGWLYTFSGLKEIVQEMAKMNSPSVKLCIVGAGDLLETLVSLKKKHSLKDRVTIINWVNYRELSKYVNMADICLLPAYQNQTMNEIVPIKIYEYLAVEKPVITTKLQGIMKEFGNNNGVVYVESSRDAYHKAINLTDERIAKLGKQGRNFVEKNCDWNKLTAEFEKIMFKLKKLQK